MGYVGLLWIMVVFPQISSYSKIRKSEQGRVFIKGAYSGCTIYIHSNSRSFKQNQGQTGSRYVIVLEWILKGVLG